MGVRRGWKTRTAPLLIGTILFGAVCGALASPALSSEPKVRALVLVETAGPKTAGELLAEGFVVVREFNGRLLALATDEERARIESKGLGCTILDTDTAGNTYYTAWLHDAETARSAAPLMTVLVRDGLEVVLRASPKEAERLAAAGVELARVFFTPMRANPETGPILPPVPIVPDPRIQQMVASVSSARIDSRVQRLQDFRTRYAASDSCLIAANWIKSRP